MAEDSVAGLFGASGPLEMTIIVGNEVDLSGNAKMQEKMQKTGWRKFVAFAGPGVLVSIAFLDPGNLQSDLEAGAQYRYELLWIILVGTVFGWIIQCLAANLGVATGKHLAEHYREEYPRKVNFILWVIAESTVAAQDIPEVLGTAFALNMLFHIPMWVGVLLTGLSTLIFLGVQRYGMRKLEAVIAILLLILFASFIGELAYAKPKPKEVLKGLFVPVLSGSGAFALAISLLGALITPHNLFLHSALVQSRNLEHSVSGIKSAYRYFVIETGITLFMAFIINVAVTCVSGAVCSSPNLSPDEVKKCGDLDLNKSSFLLRNVLGKGSSSLFAIALLASGQSSSITGTYAGQFIMQGFLNLKMKAWLRNFFTRSVAMVPSLIVSVIFGSSGAGKLIIITSMMFSVELPFTVIPLLKFTSSKIKMGPHKNSVGIIVLAWSIGWCIIGINIYYFVNVFVKWLVHNSLPKVASVFIAILVFALMALYIVGILYLTFRREKKVTYVAPGESATPNPLCSPNP